VTINLPSAFAGIASRVTAAFGAPFWSGVILFDGTPGYTDDDGNWVPGSPATEYPCMAQIDGADEYMKAVEGFADKEVQLIILRASLPVDLDLNTDTRVLIDDAKAPPMFRGTWLSSSLTLDPAGIGYGGKAKRQ